MNNIETQYLDLLKEMLEKSHLKKDRTGTGTLSVFGRQLRHNMRLGFPLLTTKKVKFDLVVSELLWFLQGRTDLRYLLEKNCHIWSGDAYKVYDKDFDAEHPAFSAPYPSRLTLPEFEKRIQEDDEFNKMYGNLGPIYGKQWRKWKAYKHAMNFEPYLPVNKKGTTESYVKIIDQIANLIYDLKNSPDSRRLMVIAYNVGELDQMVLPPCHYAFQLWTRELDLEERMDWWFRYKKPNRDVCDEIDSSSEDEKLSYLDKAGVPKRACSLMFNMRSADLCLGVPFNIASYALLLEIFCKMLNMLPEELVASLGDAHIYLDHIEGARTQCARTPGDLPELKHLKTPDFYKSLSESLSLFGHLETEDFVVEGYNPHPAIKFPLSN
jgi:thymidylate synthase